MRSAHSVQHMHSVSPLLLYLSPSIALLLSASLPPFHSAISSFLPYPIATQLTPPTSSSLQLQSTNQPQQTMEAESSTSNHHQRKRKRTSTEASDKPLLTSSSWRTDKEHRLYSSKLLQALRRVRSGSGFPRAEPPRSRAVREAADRALGISARGRTRWSRAILNNRSIRLKANRIRVPVPAPAPIPARTNRTEQPEGKSEQKKKAVVLQRKARVLGRLVPGCKKLAFPTLLEEASDYIKALEMQVKAMSALTEILAMIGGGAEGVPPVPVQDAGTSTGTGPPA